MIGCKPICFFGEVPPRQERTKKKPYAGEDRAGTACGQTDTEEEPGKLAERTSQSLVCQVVRRKSAERCGSPAATSKGHWLFEAPTEPTGETSSLRGSRAAALPSGCDALRHILLGIIWRIAGGRFAASLHRVVLSRARRSLRDPRKERWSLKLTRHNGRAGKHGTYNPKHNDRSFEITNSEHIDPKRVQQNIYWDCYNGIRSALQPKDADSLADTFEEVEKLYYKLHYTNFTEKQNERNAKIRHTERNRSTEDLLASKKTCPEESIYQLGTLESHASSKDLFQIATEFMDEFHERFGKHVHILDWALHLDEGTPHIHERHVFDCENKYGEIAPQQEKALEALGFELPKPDKPLGRYNNRKITFDVACRTMLFEIAKRHGLELDEVPEYGGRAYLEKQDYIMAKQKEQLAQQEKTVQEQTVQLENLKQEHENERLQQVRHTTYQSLTIMSNDKKIQKQENRLDELSQQIEDSENLLEEISAIAYDKAVAVVSEKAAKDALRESTAQIDLYLDWLRKPERKASKSTLEYTLNQFTTLRKRVVNAVNQLASGFTASLTRPEIKKPAIEQIKEDSRPSVLQKLQQRQKEINQREQTRTKPKKRSHGMEL